MTNLVGTTLGQYQIVELIGEGGMASVYKAWQPSLRRYVALKVLAPHLSSDAEFVQRFHQEAVSAANLKQTNIVTIHDVGTESGYHYIAMEIIDGVSLEEHIRSGQAFALEQVVGIISQIGSALDYAHQRGFIHRDIKPANILIDASGRAVLTDFGIVKALSGSGVTSALTRAGTVFGTPHYMSPEQVRDEPLDHRSDLYALGIVCYEMLTGQVPFDGTTTHAVLYAQVNDPPPPLRQVMGPAAPPPVEAVVNKMLAKERANRYNSAGEFARDLAQAASGVWPAGVGGETVVATPMGTGTAVMGEPPAGMPAATVVQPTPAPYTPTAYTPTPPPMPAPARRSRWPLVLGTGAVVIGGLLILAAVVWVLVLGKGNPLKSIQAALDLRNAQAALDVGDYAQAVDGFSQVLESDSDSVEAIEGLLEAAANLAQAGQLDATIAAYEAVWRVKPGEIQALQSLGQVYEAKGEWEQAAVWYEKWTQAAPGDENGSLALGNARFNLGEYESTVAEYERAELLGASSVEMDTHLGLAYYELAQYDKAIEHLQNGVSQNPEDFQLQRALGVSLYAQGQPEQAVEHLNKAIELGADRSGDELMDVYYALGGCYFEKQDYEQAISFYEQAQEFDPEDKGVWAGEARANLDEAYSRLAEGVMEEALLDLDFSNIATEGDETYVIAKTGQRARIEGAVRQVDGPWEGSQALVVEEGTENIVTNPSLEVDMNDWIDHNGGSISRVTTTSRFGGASLKVDAGGDDEGTRSSMWSVIASETYAASVWVKGSGNWRLRLREVDASDTTIGYTGVDFTATDTWQRVTVAREFSVNGVKASIYVTTNGAQSATVYVDAAQLERKTHATLYCDGSLGSEYSWSGAPHGSASEREVTEPHLDDYVDLISGNDTLSFRIVAQMPYDADGIWTTSAPYLMDSRYGGGFVIIYYDTTDDKFKVYINDDDYLASSAQTFKADDWIDLVVTLDFMNDAYALYVNDVMEDTDTTSLPAQTLQVWRLGVRSNHTSYLGGAFSEFAVFDRVLTVSEVAALYRMGVSAGE